jgi:hypothetical protein
MTRSSFNPVFVQFPHPGREHNPGKARRQPWNRGEHGRKFLRSNGRYVARDNSLHGASLVFWGEWEPPSYVIKECPKNGALPRFRQEPVWEHPKDSEPRENTDPWVLEIAFSTVIVSNLGNPLYKCSRVAPSYYSDRV